MCDGKINSGENPWKSFPWEPPMSHYLRRSLYLFRVGVWVYVSVYVSVEFWTYKSSMCGVSSSFGDHYEWNKVTSCIHNILSGQRWIEHYGEMAIKNINSDVCQCKVTFVKVGEQVLRFAPLKWKIDIWRKSVRTWMLPVWTSLEFSN